VESEKKSAANIIYSLVVDMVKSFFLFNLLGSKLLRKLL
jgi:hypothetical protein